MTINIIYHKYTLEKIKSYLIKKNRNIFKINKINKIMIFSQRKLGNSIPDKMSEPKALISLFEGKNAW